LAYLLTLHYADGAERVVSVADGQTVLEAAEASGVPIVSSCQTGVCGTCVALCTAGTYALGTSIGLSEAEKIAGRILTCQTRLNSDCAVELDYPLGRNSASIVSGEATVRNVTLLSPTSALLTLDTSGLPAPLRFRPGQFAQIKVPGTDLWRSYSFAHAPRDEPTVEFLIRLLPQGVMSSYLRERCRPGDRIAIRGSKGDFHLRDGTRPAVLLAGGTGLSAILAIAEQLVLERCTGTVRLYYGVNRPQELVLLERLQELQNAHAQFDWQTIVREPTPDWHGAVGCVTDLLESSGLDQDEADVYLCGPPAMVEAARDWIKHRGLRGASVYYEKFVATGSATLHTDATAPRPVRDLESLRELGRGTAVVIGGSIAGIAAAKVLTGFFDKVVVLEKDSDHRRMEGRPGAAQGWHLHHLLLAGQRLLESVFPGIIGEMVDAGAFKVDMGEQYRVMIAGSWKKVGRSGIEIVCAGRPLLEWCLRRRLESESSVDFRYENEARDLVYCPSAGAVVGVEVERSGAREIVAAEFVVDAAGKNTPVPAALERAGLEPPEAEEDQINCFYSTMRHTVSEERAWHDKVMTICYAHRPQQHHYAAQYFTDRSRRVLSTTLVGYNCYGPPRNAEEFREFARRMPSPLIGNEIDGLEPCSPVYNFRYPTMQRNRYELLRRPPAGLVAVGDSYASADPVSGAGMSKALMELAELRALLSRRRVRDAAFVRAYYRRIRRTADSIWAVIREQNLRFPWIPDVKRKRPFHFRLQNWYVDRVFEGLHEDPEIYRRYLAVSHFVAPASSLVAPGILVRVLGRWLAVRLRGGATLIERNFGRGAP
jgi:NAD(P)H-flavin reductase/ferredoxin/2-polyprenyl-6-methoxyphenol hydroxylase-like FAD-dependent oxidoreductase